jgi:hypothetical protein
MVNWALGEVPAGDTAHFSERRGFERLYHKNPHAQERGAMFLVGFIALHEESGEAHDKSPEVAAALRLALADFVGTYPEFLLEGDSEFGHFKPQPEVIAAVRDVLDVSSGRIGSLGEDF